VNPAKPFKFPFWEVAMPAALGTAAVFHTARAVYVNIRIDLAEIT
jgi:hypothetical protein